MMGLLRKCVPPAMLDVSRLSWLRSWIEDIAVEGREERAL